MEKSLELLCNNMKKLRKIKELTIAEAAFGLGISASYLSEVENHKKAPSFDIIDRVAIFYSVEVYELFV